jgi:cytochrome d ubiquinol oxidase subunit II
MTDMAMDLNITWFALVSILLAGYAMLDGFDLGVGALHLFVKEDRERRIFLNAIGPVWDGNEVWLVTGGGALFAAFPEVYAQVFSGFYFAFILLLFALIFRAVAIEFRSKRPERWWRNLWDVSFSVASIASTLLLGIAFGNVIWGVELNQAGEVQGGFMSLLNPFSLMMGVTTLSLFMMHGAMYLSLKTEGETQAAVRRWIKNTMIFFIMCYGIMTMAALLYAPHMADHMRNQPLLFTLPVLTMLAVANIPRMVHAEKDFLGFLSSCAAILGLFAIYAVGAFPNLLFARNDPALSLTIYNAASSPGTLKNMLIIAAIGVPLVLSYTACIYYIFRGKVKLDAMSY